MRQVDEAELIVAVRFHLARLPASVRKGLASDITSKRREAEQLATTLIVQKALYRYEILSSAPLPEGTDLFSRAAYGEEGTGAPPIKAGG